MTVQPAAAGTESAGSPGYERPAEADHVPASLARTAARMLGGAVHLFGVEERSVEWLGSSDGAEPGSSIGRLAAEAADVGARRRARLECGPYVAEPVGSRGCGAAGVIVAEVPAKSEPEVDGVLADLRVLGRGWLEREYLAARAADLEDALTDWRSRYFLMSETVSSGVVVVASTGEVQEVNSQAAEILGDVPEGIIGRDFREFVAPEDLDRVVAEFAERLAGNAGRWENEMRVVRPSGETRLVQVCSSGVLSDRGVVGVYFAARDITDERARTDRLRRAERLASVAPLLSGVCHELNNPLTSIKSFAELMLLDERPDEDVESLEIIKREAARAGRIVSDLRLVARQTQEEAASAVPLDLNAIVRDACASVRSAIEEADAQVALELAHELPLFYGVKNQIERVVAQLVTNAAQALRGRSDPRRIALRTSTSADGIALTVTDNGPGVAPDHIDHIFDPFWSSRATGEGTGLGLSLAHSVITDHHGELHVDGGWGRGATFTVQLPIVSHAERPGRQVVVQAPASTSLRILVVDDEGPIRYSLARYMERRGHVVRDAAEGGAALQILEDTSEPAFDIVLADLRMPGLDGEELYARLKARGDGLEERVIFITGDAESPEAARVLEAAGVPVVLKPFDLPEIAQIIEAHAGVLR